MIGTLHISGETALHVAAMHHGKSTRTGSNIDSTQTILALLRRGASLNTGVCRTQTILALIQRGASLNTGIITYFVKLYFWKNLNTTSISFSLKCSLFCTQGDIQKKNFVVKCNIYLSGN